LKANAPRGIIVESRIIPQQVEYCILSGNIDQTQTLECGKSTVHLPGNAHERVVDIFVCRKILIDDSAQKRAEDGIQDDVSRV
jgi:hypothetical protein